MPPLRKLDSRYLVICAQGFGDTLEATPMLAELRRLEPSATIDAVVTQVAPRVLLESLPELVDSVVYLPLWEKGRRQFVAHLVLKRWRRSYDVTFLCYPGARPEYHLLSFAFPSRRRVAHAYGRVTLQSLLWLETDLCPIAPSHNVIRNIELLRSIGLDPTVPERYSVPEMWKAGARDKRPNGLVFHVGTVAHHGRESRRWPLEYFAELARLCLDAGYSIDILAGPSEVEESEYVQRLAPGTRIFQGTLVQAANFLAGAELVVTNDNGIGHLAAAVDAPVIAIFGPTPLEHAPFGPSSYPIRMSDCPPCFDVRRLYSRCERDIGFRCLREMGPRDVFARVQEIVRGEPVPIDLIPLAMD
jgi:ADP-heptose:LPS heptosyltransferase